MIELPNGIVVFNATPHRILFWFPFDGNLLIEAPPDEVISASLEEVERDMPGLPQVWLKELEWVPNKQGRDTIRRAKAAGADVIVGSEIAARAYAGAVVCQLFHTNYGHRVPPKQRRARGDVFRVFRNGR